MELWLGHPRTIVFEVPNAQGFIGGGRDQHQAAVGGKGQIPNNVSVIHQIQQQCSWKSNTGLYTKKVKGKQSKHAPFPKPKVRPRFMLYFEVALAF